ncbi:hypothetical protein EYB53_024810 [Candidatus Chloroploca sp. M-50]|uniref:Uncharacterized protein n=1 Tax=Candidatus Chloroploca mongolica TaxID=2528176 RepID=A0ABS4DHR1_9CHLR|nr:hypothetical protein [Candidatus Chloroploca mongolica]MBP1468953.1 hypothetical protein [Candidatus Chloroploca mongolica]
MSNSNLTAEQYLQQLQFHAMLEVGIFPEIEAEKLRTSLQAALNQLPPEQLRQQVLAEIEDFERDRQRERDRLMSDPQLRVLFDQVYPGSRVLTEEELAATALRLSATPEQFEAFWRIAMPTPYEHPLFHRALVVVKPLIEKAVARLNLSPSSLPLIGTLPTGEFHARVMPVPDSAQSLVLFNNGWFAFLLRAIPILFRYINSLQPAIQSLTRSEIERLAPGEAVLLKALSPKDQVKAIVAADLYKLMAAYLTTLNPSKTPYAFNQLPDPFKMMVTAHWLQPIQFFVMAHEYGHLINGDLDPAKAILAKIGDEIFAYQETSWDDEFRADETGMRIVLKAWESSHARHVPGAAIDIFFILVELLEQARARLTFGNADGGDNSYPPAGERRERARIWMLANVEPKTATYLANLYWAFDDLYRTLSSSIQVSFIALHAQGVRPMEPWTRSIFHLYPDRGM